MEFFEGCTVKIVTDRSGCKLRFMKAGDDVAFNNANFHVRDDDVFIIGYSRSVCCGIEEGIDWKSIPSSILQQTGTHWMYEMVGMLLNGNTETIGKNKEHLMMGAIPVDKLEKMPSPRLLNNHFWPKQVPRDILMSKKMIYLLRNPKDILVSDYYFRKSYSPPQFHGKNSYNGKFSDWLELCLQGEGFYDSWFDYVRAWEDIFVSDEAIDPIIVHYEDMKRDTVGVLKRISERLGLKRTEEFLKNVSVACQINKMRENKDKKEDDFMKKMSSNNFIHYRKGVIGDWKTHFTVADNEKFDEAYREKMKGSKLKFVFE